MFVFFFSSRRRHTRFDCDWSSDVCSSDLGASHFIQQIFTAIFLTNCTQLSELIRTGKLDFMLLLPVNTRFMISFRQVDLGGFVNAASAVAVVLFAGRQMHPAPGRGKDVGFVLLGAVGGVI